uniref:Wsv108 n=1 Tax=Haemonchus contortus TaxID=6289 RepID=A0A7I4YMR1_HAECO
MKPWLFAPDHRRYRRTPRIMLPTPDVKAQPRSRRRYAQGSTRSKTIELGTLSEIEEDIYHNKEAASQSGVGSQDDSAVNVRWPKNGAVKSIARHFSERLKSEQVERPISNGSNGNSSGSNGNIQSKCEFKPDQTDFRQQLMDCTNRRRVQYMPERSCSRTSFTQWDKAHYVDEKCRLPHSTMSEFYASAAASSLARTQAAIPIQSTPSSSTGTILVPNSRVMSMADPRAPKLHVSNCPMSIWYSPQPTFPPPPPMYIPIGHPVMPLPPKILIKRKKSSACSEICCGGVAQMLWTLICVVLLGIVGVLITALFYV